MSQETLIHLECSLCHNLGYNSKRNKKGKAASQGNTARLEIKKYCKWCKKHSLHKETK